MSNALTIVIIITVINFLLIIYSNLKRVLASELANTFVTQRKADKQASR